MTTADDIQATRIDSWAIVTDHATAFRAVDLGPDEPVLVGKHDGVLDADTKAEFVRLDQKIEQHEGPGGFRNNRIVLRKAEPFGGDSTSPSGAQASEAAKWKGYAFVVRRVFSANDEPTQLLVDIQSWLLRDIIKLVFWEQQYSSYFLNYEKPSLPPVTLLTRLPELVKVWNDLKAPECKKDPRYAEYLKLLLDYLQTECADSIASFMEHLKDGVVSYKNLRSLFRPDQLIVGMWDGEYEVLKVKSVTMGNGKWEIMANGVQFDGGEFGVVTQTAEVNPFTGLKKITELDVYPLSLAPNAAEIRADVLERGRKYASFREILHCSYKGPVLGGTQHAYDGRIIIDHCAYQHHTRVVPLLAPFSTLADHVVSIEDLGRRVDMSLHDDTIIRPRRVRPIDTYDWDNSPDVQYTDAQYERQAPPPPRKGRSSIYRSWEVDRDRETGVSEVKLTDEQLLLCPPYIPGFAILDKAYCCFLVRNIQDINWKPTAFDQVVIPDRHKQLLLAMIKGHNKHRKDRNAKDDIVEGKGKGLVILLHGPPGVGKTVTAEAIVEQTQQPLYVVSAAELGISASHLEATLRSIFDVAYAWNAIVLIDEADVFLEARSLDFMRSELVTTFLRELEYFQGVLILTTNRVQRFDRALRSRIHLALKYNELDEDARLRIWKLALKDTDWVGSSEDLVTLAGREANGREIKYCVRSATALAEQSNEILTVKHFETVLDLADDFERELELGSDFDDKDRE